MTSSFLLFSSAFLNFLPFACLLDAEGRFLIERYNLSYLSSGRDLLKKSLKPLHKKTMHIFSNPQFETQMSASNKVLTSGQRDIGGGDFGSLSLNSLPGTEVEANKLKNLAERFNWSVLSSTGVEAREEKLATSNSPVILHLATHGFYFGNKCLANAQSGERGMSINSSQNHTLQENAMSLINPMLLSGIALSGAQNTFKQWGEGKAPDPATDGIVTAEEVGCLNLTDTWLVSLSACETGIGEAKSGEGVFGLRRSFMMAGTKNLLMTLWPVDDEATAGFMADFYSMALNSNEAAKSLAQTQRDCLIKKRQEQGLLVAVRDAGPFVMATTGN
jgi:CHAT domain-containing protein